MTEPRRRRSSIGLATLVTTTLLAAAWVPLASAGDMGSPEIMDAEGDVNPASFAVNAELDQKGLRENETAYDVVKAWIDLESAYDFWLFILVSDLPDGWGAGLSPPEVPPEPNATQSHLSVAANFSVAGYEYRAVAEFSMPNVGVIQDNYTLWRGASQGAVSGAYNTTGDWVAIRLPKDAFLGLQDQVKLTNFWAMGLYGNRTMDFAPNAKDLTTGSQDPLLIAQRVASGKLVQPQYGRDYVFGDYDHQTGGGGSSAADLQLSLIGEAEKEIEADGSASFEIRVTNRASASDTAYFVLNSASTGWSHQLSEANVVLGPGQSKHLFLVVFADEAASPDWMMSVVSASSTLGALEEISVTTYLAEAMGPDESPAPSSPIGEGPGGAEGGDSPGFEVLLAAIAALAVLGLRRRRQ